MTMELISIHVPLAGHDPTATAGAVCPPLFQSTCPLRGTTGTITTAGTAAHFNPRAPCGARPAAQHLRRQTSLISIHVPLAGHDSHALRRVRKADEFQSTCPLRGTTERHRPSHHRAAHFNPRAPCGARPDLRDGTPSDGRTNFNPRAPCGARHQTLCDECAKRLFQSTCPLRGTTGYVLTSDFASVISIHVPLAGHDILLLLHHRWDFISIHVPLAGHDLPIFSTSI